MESPANAAEAEKEEGENGMPKDEVPVDSPTHAKETQEEGEGGKSIENTHAEAAKGGDRSIAEELFSAIMSDPNLPDKVRLLTFFEHTCAYAQWVHMHHFLSVCPSMTRPIFRLDNSSYVLKFAS